MGSPLLAGERKVFGSITEVDLSPAQAGSQPLARQISPRLKAVSYGSYAAYGDDAELRSSRAERRFELRRRHRPAVQKSLHDFAVLAPQKRELRFRFHALGDDAEIQGAGHRDHGRDDRAIIRSVGEI